MTEFASLTYIVRATRFDAWILVITALSAVIISIEFCILIGVVLSFALYIPRAAKISVSELAITRQRVIREVQPTDVRCKFIRLYNLEGELFFGSAPEFERLLESIEKSCDAELRVVIFRIKRARNPDAVCMQILQAFIQRMHARGTTVMLTGVSSDVHHVLANVGIVELIGARNVFREESALWAGTIEALRRSYAMLDSQRCQGCPQPFADTHPSEWSYMI